MDAALPIVVPLLLVAGLFFVVWLIVADSTRYLAGCDLRNWRERHYLKALPNFLQALHDNHFVSAWPARLNSVSTAYFAYRVRLILRARSSVHRRSFLRQHFNLRAQLQILRPFINDALMADQVRIVTNCVINMEDTADRDRLMNFIERTRRYRMAFQQSLTSFDRATIAQMKYRNFVQTLRRVHAVCLEHGFTLMPEFDVLRRWEELSGSELVQELPRLPDARTLWSPRAKVLDTAAFQQGAKPGSDMG